MRLFPRIVSLPMYASMTPETVDRVAASVKRIVCETRSREVA